MKKVVFMGTPDFAAGILEALIEAGYEVSSVFTQPDKPRGRGKSLQMSPVKELAQRHGIFVCQPRRIREAENADLLRDLKPDFIVVAAYGQIIPQEILDIPPLGCLNVHASLLPAWRGAAPIQWSILAGDRETGVTIMRMDAGLDTGDIISQTRVRIADDETGGSLFDRLMGVGADLLTGTMKEIEAGRATYTPQPKESPTPYSAQMSKKSGLIDWTRSAAEIERTVRALSPWPSAFTYDQGKLLKIWKASVVPFDETGEPTGGQEASRASAQHADGQSGQQTTPAPGTIVRVDKKHLYVQTGDGLLALIDLQPEGKKRMPVDAYLRGYHPAEGDLLGAGI